MWEEARGSPMTKLFQPAGSNGSTTAEPVIQEGGTSGNVRKCRGKDPWRGERKRERERDKGGRRSEKQQREHQGWRRREEEEKKGDETERACRGIIPPQHPQGCCLVEAAECKLQ